MTVISVIEIHNVRTVRGILRLRHTCAAPTTGTSRAGLALPNFYLAKIDAPALSWSR